MQSNNTLLPIQDDLYLNSIQHYLLRDAPMSYDKLMHQVDIRIAIAKQAITEHLDKKYPTKKHA